MLQSSLVTYLLGNSTAFPIKPIYLHTTRPSTTPCQFSSSQWEKQGRAVCLQHVLMDTCTMCSLFWWRMWQTILSNVWWHVAWRIGVQCVRWIQRSEGDHEVNLKRTENETVVILKKFVKWDTSAEFKESFAATSIQPISPPFWHSLPHTNIFQSFTPDLLHQLHKGVFKDHLVKWCMGILGEDKINQRFRSMSRLTGLQHFKNGISSVSQWTGSEHKEMEIVFLGLIVDGSADEHVTVAVHVVIDFIYLASLQSHTTQTLALLTSTLDTFHANKQVFIKLEACTQDHFGVPKVHSMEHYVEMIVLYGSADGYNTESPERLHINYAKDTYAATNKKDYVKQMTTWLSQQEAIDWFSSYLNWCIPPTPIPDPDPDIDDNPFPGFNDNIGSLNDHDIPTEQVLHINKSIPKPMRQVPAHRIIQDHNARQFLPALETFLQSNTCFIRPQPLDCFNLHSRISTRLPKILESGSQNTKNVVRAVPPMRGSGRGPGDVARLDFALVRKDEANPYTAGTPLEGE